MSKVVRISNARIILVIALAAVVFSTACSKNANTGNSTNSTNSGTTNSASSTSSSGGTAATGSPTAALRGYYQAAMNKDINAAKRYLSAGTMALLEEGAKKMGKSLDEAFQESATQSNTTTMPEFSNEKITGDTATVDMKAQGMSVTMPMVKEGGEWKLAMDKLINDMKNSMSSEGPKGATGGADDDDEKHEGNSNH
jgi:flagellar hook-associated protein FlgK